MAENGRPETTDTDYRHWLDCMEPFLKLGHALNAAIEEAALLEHRTTIYEKYKLGDWFSYKVDVYRATPGVIANDILTKTLFEVNTKIKQGLPVTEEEMRNVRFMAEKHRTAQPYFVTRTETAESDPDKVGKILDTMEMSDYDELGRQAKKQMVANDAPVQDKG